VFVSVHLSVHLSVSTLSFELTDLLGHYYGSHGIETEGQGQDAVGLTSILDRGQFSS